VGEPPRIQTECGEIAGGFGKNAVSAAAQRDLEARVAELAKLDAFVGGFAENFSGDDVVFRRIVELIGRKLRVLAGLEAGFAVETALQPRVVGGFDERIRFRILEPAIAVDSVETARELVGRVVVRHREALPRSVEHGAG
jgi:hypothetical protein